MTESEWATCDNPKMMLGFVAGRGLASERKLRLFSCACCRRIWHLSADQRVREAVSGIEKYADDLAREDLREQALSAAAAMRDLVGQAARWASVAAAMTGAMMVVDAAGQAAACPPGQDYDPARWQAEWRSQCGLLRDLFWPFPSGPLRIDPTWLASNDGVVRRLAEAIYGKWLLPDGHLDASRMGVLADALEDAGCDNADILNHCRNDIPHVRGCWVVDLLLGNM